MGDPGNIRYITRKEIDNKKWDRCIDQSANGLIYGYTIYLDQMAAQWDGLVMGDYELVMPLTWKRKYGINYLYQPFLTAQLGVFGNNITAGIVESFLRSIPSTFRYWDIYLNHGNALPLPGFALYERSNYVLDLSLPYDELSKNFRDNIRRNSRKAWQVGCVVEKDFPVEKVIRLALLQMGKHAKAAVESVERFRRLYEILYVKKMASTYGIVSNQGELLSSCVFFFSHNRAYYILVGNHPNGKTIGASHALIDVFIKDHAGRQLLLDFEGSDIRNLAFFYSSFGAILEPFAGLRLNRLPFYLKWIK